MASQAKAQLLRLGPFKGLDATTAGPYAEQDRASATSGVDIRRIPGAFVTARGRVNITTFGASSGSEIVTLAELVARQGSRYLIASLSSGEVYWYCPNAGAILPNGQPFSQAAQYGPSLFTNSGQQITLSKDGFTPVAAQWQYGVSDVGFVPAVALNSHVGVKMTQQQYTYLFTIAVQLPTRTYAPDAYGQESTPTGFSLGANGTAVYAFDATVADSDHDVLLSCNNTNTWTGQLQDGTTWGVNVYRMSDAQPIFYLCASAFWVAGDAWGQLVNGSAFEDSQSDKAIAANKQILFNQDPPPLSVDSPGAVFSHKERLWVFTVVENDDTLNQPQSQLWYSSYGLPWQFDAANQVLLVGNDGTPDSTGSPDYGDLPVAGVSLASVGALFKSRTLWILYGDDENTFIVRKVGEYGCVSAGSVVVCQGIVYWLNEEGIFAFDGANAPQYISERIRDALESIPIADWQASIAWFSKRAYFISFPHVLSQESVSFVGRLSAANNGNPSVSVETSPQIQLTTQPAKTASAVVACTGTWHRPTPDPDTWFYTYICHAAGNTPASWAVSVSTAPVDASTQISFKGQWNTTQGIISLSLQGPGGTTVKTFGDIGPGVEYDYFDPAAVTGTYTWIATVDTTQIIRSGGDDTSGTYSVTVTPTTGVVVPAGTAAAQDGVRTTLQTRVSAAPVDATTQLSLLLSAVVAPADANGATSYTVQLADPSGTIVLTDTGITSDTTINYSDPAATAGAFTWTVWATVAPLNVASETYACSCMITATWTEPGVITSYSEGVTFVYDLPTKEWFTLPYSTNAVIAQPSENAPTPALQDLNSVLAARLGTLELDAWDAAELDLGLLPLGTWTGPITDSGSPGVEKSYDLVQLTAPVQGTTATVTLLIDPGSATLPNKEYTWSVDLSKGPTSVWTVPNDSQNSNRGYLAQLSVSAPPSVGGSPAVIYSVAVYGEPARTLVPIANGAVS